MHWRIVARRTQLGALAGALGVSLTAACTPVQPSLPHAAPPEPSPEAHPDWAPETTSRRLTSIGTGLPAALLARCDDRDSGLDAVAAEVAERRATGAAALDAGALAHALRRRGVPHVWPAAWTLTGTELEPSDAEARFERWLEPRAPDAPRRCGAAEARGSSTHALAVVVVDAIAELEPLPTRARAGQWLHLDAHMLVPFVGAKVIVLGPQGPPRTVPTSVRGSRVRATFSADRVGQWLVQLLPDVEGGPRPALEASVFVDTPYPQTVDDGPAPGESGFDSRLDPRDALARMIGSAREDAHLRVLHRDAHLDALALDHARAMHRAGWVGHDVGNGPPATRLARGGVSATVFGENVAHAQSLIRAHRALWASPSHRSNLLHPRFSAFGVGVSEEADGSVWVCELFADFDSAGTLDLARHVSRSNGLRSRVTGQVR